MNILANRVSSTRACSVWPRLISKITQKKRKKILYDSKVIFSSPQALQFRYQHRNIFPRDNTVVKAILLSFCIITLKNVFLCIKINNGNYCRLIMSGNMRTMLSLILFHLVMSFNPKIIHSCMNFLHLMFHL